MVRLAEESTRKAERLAHSGADACAAGEALAAVAFWHRACLTFSGACLQYGTAVELLRDEDGDAEVTTATEPASGGGGS